MAMWPAWAARQSRLMPRNLPAICALALSADCLSQFLPSTRPAPLG